MAEPSVYLRRMPPNENYLGCFNVSSAFFAISPLKSSIIEGRKTRSSTHHQMVDSNQIIAIQGGNIDGHVSIWGVSYKKLLGTKFEGGKDLSWKP